MTHAPEPKALRCYPIEILDGDRSSNYPKEADFVSFGVPFLSSPSLVDGRIDATQLRFITPQKFEQFKKGRLKPNDIIMTTRGTIGRLARFQGGFTEGLINAQMLIFRADDVTVDQRFLFHLMSGSDFQAILKSFASGSAQPQIPIRDLREVPLAIPDYHSQRRIADILSAYDDLIENNTRRIVILEDMARRLFEEWFVLRRAPDAIAQSEDWTEATIGDAFTLQRGFDLPTGERSDGPYPVVAASGVHGFHRDFKVKGPGVTTGRSGTIGQFQYIENNFWPLNTSLWIKEFKHGGPIFAYYLLSSLDLTGSNTGAAVPSLNRNIVHALPTSLPPLALVSAFEQMAGEKRRMIASLRNANTNLRTTRDLLLPKLISGEIEVRAAEEALEAAVA